MTQQCVNSAVEKLALDCLVNAINIRYPNKKCTTENLTKTKHDVKWCIVGRWASFIYAHALIYKSFDDILKEYDICNIPNNIDIVTDNYVTFSQRYRDIFKLCNCDIENAENYYNRIKINIHTLGVNVFDIRKYVIEYMYPNTLDHVIINVVKDKTKITNNNTDNNGKRKKKQNNVVKDKTEIKNNNTDNNGKRKKKQNNVTVNAHTWRGKFIRYNDSKKHLECIYNIDHDNEYSNDLSWIINYSKWYNVDDITCTFGTHACWNNYVVERHCSCCNSKLDSDNSDHCGIFIEDKYHMYCRMCVSIMDMSIQHQFDQSKFTDFTEDNVHEIANQKDRFVMINRKQDLIKLMTERDEIFTENGVWNQRCNVPRLCAIIKSKDMTDEIKQLARELCIVGIILVEDTNIYSYIKVKKPIDIFKKHLSNLEDRLVKSVYAWRNRLWELSMVSSNLTKIFKKSNKSLGGNIESMSVVTSAYIKNIVDDMRKKLKDPPFIEPKIPCMSVCRLRVHNGKLIEIEDGLKIENLLEEEEEDNNEGEGDENDNEGEGDNGECGEFECKRIRLSPSDRE